MFKQSLTFLAIVAVAYLIFWQGKPAVDALMTTEISMLLKKSHQFDGRRVTVSGTVVQSAAIFGVGGYTLEQGGAEIFVMTTRGIPEMGSQVTVSGTFKQAIAINDLQYAVILERK